MPYLETAQEWLSQSALLLQARPSSTRITTKYSLPKAPKGPESSPAPTTASTTPKPPPTATLTLKTFDPASGATLKYKTNKQAEVSRLIQILGRLGRGMAGLSMEVKDEPMEAKKEEEESVPVKAGASGKGGVPPAAPSQGGKKGKKKGKK